jgi:TM2 domain-containing membrane protein YozV
VRRAARRALARLVPEENPSGAIYGAIAIGALLAAESGRHETYLDTIGSAVIATALYWLAHAYASVLGERLATHERLSASALAQALGHDQAIVRGAAVPLLALLISWLAGAAQQTAVNVALWSTVTSLVAFELLAGIRSRAAPPELALEVGVGIAMGVAILALKIVLH